MGSKNKYRLGNEPTEYELVTVYLGWIPRGFTNWEGWLLSEEKRRFKKDIHELLKDELPQKLTIENFDKSKKTDLLMHQVIMREAFPSKVFNEERATNWFRFCIVSKQSDPEIQFIIPLH